MPASFFSAAPTSIHIWLVAIHGCVCRFLLSVVHMQVFLYDGSKQCTGWELGILGSISLAVMSLFIVPAPFAVGYICVKYPRVRFTLGSELCLWSNSFIYKVLSLKIFLNY